MAPPARQRAALHEKGGSDARTIMHCKALDIKKQCVHNYIKKLTGKFNNRDSVDFQNNQHSYSPLPYL